MANTFSILDYNSTFGDWLVATNNLIKENNDVAANNYIKPTGTLFLNDPALGLQTANSAIIGGALQVQGIGSSAYVQNNLRVDGQVYFTNTVLGLVNTGQANIGGTILALSSGTGINVSNNAIIGGTLNTSGSVNFGNTLSVYGNTSLSNNLVVNNNTTTNNIVILNSSNTNSLLVLNIATVGNSLTVTNQIYTNNIQANTSVNTSIVTTSTTNNLGTVYTNYLQANNRINSSILTITDTAYINAVQANVSVNTATLSVTANANLASLIVTGTSIFVGKANTVNDLGIGGNQYVTGNQTVNGNGSIIGNLNVSGTTTLTGKANTVNDLGIGGNQYVTGNQTVNGNLNVSGTTTLTGKANTVNDLGIGGNLYISHIVLPAGGSIIGDSGQGGSSISANSVSVGSGGLSVQGAFTVNGTTVYNTPDFVLSSNTPNPSFAKFGVFRTANGSISGTTSNSYIRWNESQKYWDLTANNSSEPYYRILTDQYINNTGTSSSTTNIASSFALSTANTFLQNSITSANTQLKAYADGLISYNNGIDVAQNTRLSTVEANTIYLFGALTQTNTNIVNANTQLKSYTDGQVSTLNSNIVSANTQLKSYTDGAISSANTQLKSYVDGSISYKTGIDNSQNTRLSTVEANTIYLFGALNQTNTNIVSANTQLKSYVDGAISSAVSSANTQLKSYTDGQISTVNSNIVNANTQLKSYTDGLISYNASINNTQNTNITTAINLAQGAYNQANTDYTTISVSAGTYGGTTAIPVFSVSANGRISSISNTSIVSGATITITDDITSDDTRYIMLGTATSGIYTVANTSSTQLYFNPSTGTLSSVIFNSLSDESQKTNIKEINNATGIINQIDGVEFDWASNGQKSSGVIAQQLEKILPWLVTENEGIKSVNYSGLIAYLIESNKELSDRIEKLENK